MTTDLTRYDEDDDLDIGFDVSSIMMIVMMLLMASIMSGVAASTAQTAQVMQSMVYEGKRYQKHLVVTSELTWLTFDPPLVEVEVENEVPDGVRWSIDTPEDMMIIDAGNHDGASRVMSVTRIKVLFLKCLGGETATVWVYGEY